LFIDFYNILIYYLNYIIYNSNPLSNLFTYVYLLNIINFNLSIYYRALFYLFFSISKSLSQTYNLSL